MRTLCNHLSDPSLHLLAIAIVVLYLALGLGYRSEDVRAEAPLPTCKRCQAHYLAGTKCACLPISRFARANP